MDPLKVWLSGTALLLGAVSIYSFAPILIPLIALCIFLAGLTALVVRFAHVVAGWINRRRSG